MKKIQISDLEIRVLTADKVQIIPKNGMVFDFENVPEVMKKIENHLKYNVDLTIELTGESETHELYLGTNNSLLRTSEDVEYLLTREDLKDLFNAMEWVVCYE